ncbi:anti-sigma factor antagonist [Leptospira ognonensis]|uniref:Anti-sigma factor antagonist n=1 Tax=Leptospira ognonensis TaxID=2484945 RepID=A0A4R9JYP5_9LEPT|nr:STAS domain-containing protein [Leptospira ognonensis]TGL57325.1 anti-sigma factor antagonist [Leptospira ognonensis]
MSDFTISIRSEMMGEVVVVHIQGNMDVHNTHHIEQQLMDIVREARSGVIFDLGAVNFISSAGIRVLVTSLRLCQDLGIKISICSLKPAVEKVFDVIGINQLFQIYPDLNSAL